MAIRADLFLAGQVGQEGSNQGELHVPVSWGRARDADCCTGGEEVHQTGRLLPEGMQSSILSSWLGCHSVASLQEFLLICVPASCLGHEEADHRNLALYKCQVWSQTNQKLNPDSATS